MKIGTETGQLVPIQENGLKSLIKAIMMGINTRMGQNRDRKGTRKGQNQYSRKRPK